MKMTIKEISNAKAKNASTKQISMAVVIVSVQNELLKAMNKSNKSSLTYIEIAEITDNIKI